MGPVVDQDAASRDFAARIPALAHVYGGAELVLERQDRSEGSARQHRPRFHQIPDVPELAGHHQVPVRLARGLEHPHRCVDRERQRLLAEDMCSRFQRGDRQIRMRVGRRADDHCLGTHLSKHLG